MSEKKNVYFLTTKDKNTLFLNKDKIIKLAKTLDLSEEDRQISNEIIACIQENKELPFPFTPQEENYLNQNSENKWMPYLIYRYKFCIYPKNKIVSNFPLYVLVEPTSVCNLRCTMCFQVDKTFTNKKFMGMMDINFFYKIVDELVEGGTKALTLASRGEPTLHKDLDKMLEYASGKFIDIKLNTNATKLTEKLAHKILSSGVNELVFSIDAETKALYEKIRVLGKFDEVLNNIINFNKIRKEYYPNSKLNTRVSGVRFLEEQDTIKFKEFWKNYCDEVVYVDIENRWDTYSNEVHPDIDSPCDYLWERMYIWYDGKCNPCDVDYKSNLKVGSLIDESTNDANILNKSIKEIWNGPEYQRIRDFHVSNKRSDYNPCDRCGIY